MPEDEEYSMSFHLSVTYSRSRLEFLNRKTCTSLTASAARLKMGNKARLSGAPKAGDITFRCRWWMLPESRRAVRKAEDCGGGMIPRVAIVWLAYLRPRQVHARNAAELVPDEPST